MITTTNLHMNFVITGSAAIIGLAAALDYRKEIPQQYRRIFYPVLLLCSLVTIVFLIYSYQFNSISSSTNGWSAFGSLLAGCFTLLSAGATLATLCFLIFQHEENKVLNDTEKQNKHMTLFIQLINMNEDSSSNRFLLPNKLGLYNQIFQYNPAKKITLTPTLSEGILQEIILETKKINEAISRFNSCCSTTPDWDETNIRRSACEELLGLFLEAYRRLQTQLFKLDVHQPMEGDIFIPDRNICLNIFSPFEDIERTISFANSLLRFTGNNLIEQPQLDNLWEFQCIVYNELLGSPYNNLHAKKRKKIVALFYVLYLLFDIKDDEQLASIINQISFNLSTESILKRLEDDNNLRTFIVKQREQLLRVIEQNPDHIFQDHFRQVFWILEGLEVSLEANEERIYSIKSSGKYIYPTFVN